MTSYLLDASVLLPLALDDHEFHTLVESWIVNIDSFALCSIVEGALVRTIVRLGQPPIQAQRLLSGLYADPRCQFWSDQISYADTDMTRVVGHRQVTDAYLVSLVRAHSNTRLATLDVGLAKTYPDIVELVRS